MTTDVYALMQKLCAEGFGVATEANKTDSYFVGIRSERGEWNDEVAASYCRYTADISRLSDNIKAQCDGLRSLYDAVSHYSADGYESSLNEIERKVSSL